VLRSLTGMNHPTEIPIFVIDNFTHYNHSKKKYKKLKFKAKTVSFDGSDNDRDKISDELPKNKVLHRFGAQLPYLE